MTDTNTGPLAGVRILDLTVNLSGPYSTLILAQQGADVVKVERPPVGDILRKNGSGRGGTSAYFVNTNWGKRSIALDFDRDEDLEMLRRLVTSVLASRCSTQAGAGNGTMKRWPGCCVRVQPLMVVIRRKLHRSSATTAPQDSSVARAALGPQPPSGTVHRTDCTVHRAYPGRPERGRNRRRRVPKPRTRGRQCQGCASRGLAFPHVVLEACEPQFEPGGDVVVVGEFAKELSGNGNVHLVGNETVGEDCFSSNA